MLRLPEKVKMLITEAMCCLLFSCGLSLGLSGCLFGIFPCAECLLYCALGAAAVLLSGQGKRLKLLPFFAVLAGQGIAFLYGRGAFFCALQTARAAVLYARGESNALLPFAVQAVCAFSFLCGLLGALFVRSRACGACVILCAAFFAAETALTGTDTALLFCALPCLAGCAGTAALSSRRGAVIPVLAAACLALLSFVLIPEEDTRVSPFREAADAVRQDFEDHFLFTGTRESFTLASYGYMPLGNVLGGKAEPDERQVLSVSTERTVYLRAVAYDTYNGVNWYNTLGNRRYLYTAVNKRETRRQVFDSDRPLTGTYGKTLPVTVTALVPTGATTLFAAQRIRSIETLSQRMVLYWNEGSEIFLSKNLEAGDCYTFTWLPLDADDPAVQRAAKACAYLDDSRFRTVTASYLSLPSHMQSEIYTIAEQSAAGEQDPLSRALNIRDYLRENCAYSLDVQDPPANTDFCAWFLLREKKGYCTYFATALTLLCRMQGIPARYVTGFLAAPENGTAVVTGKDAHAWCEIYLNGLGWITLDATPGENGPGTSGNRNTGGPGENRTPPSGGEAVPSPSPSPSPSPTPSPSPMPDTGETDAPVTEKNETPPPSAPVNGGDGGSDGKDGLSPWLLLLLLPLLAAIWQVLRSPDVQARLHPGREPEIRLRDLQKRLAALKLIRAKDETVNAFAMRAAALCGKDNAPLFDKRRVFRTADAVNAFLYGRRALPCREIREESRRITSAAPLLRRLFYYISR